jgi:hypothetical protein
VRHQHLDRRVQSWIFSMSAMASAIHTPTPTSADTMITAMTFLGMRGL